MGCSNSKPSPVESKPKGKKGKKGKKSERNAAKYDDEGPVPSSTSFEDSINEESSNNTDGDDQNKQKIGVQPPISLEDGASSPSGRSPPTLSLTSGALGRVDRRNAKEEEAWKKEQNALGGNYNGGGGGGLGSPKSSFRSTKQNRRSYKPTDSDVSDFETKSRVSISDKDSVMTTESFFEVLGKKVNRPRSAKGHRATEPTLEQMQDRITRHAMKGLLSDIDDYVPNASMIRTSIWAKLLTDRRRQAQSTGQAALTEDPIPGIVSIVDINNHSGDKELDDVLSLMSHFPCTSANTSNINKAKLAGGQNESSRRASSLRADPVQLPIPTQGRAVAACTPTSNSLFLEVKNEGEGFDKKRGEAKGARDETDEEEEENGITDLRRRSFIGNGNKNSIDDDSDDDSSLAVGRYYFVETSEKANIYYERIVKLWVLDYLFSREEIDVTLPPVIVTRLPVENNGGQQGGTAEMHASATSMAGSPTWETNSTSFVHSSNSERKDPQASHTTCLSSEDGPGLSNGNSNGNSYTERNFAEPATNNHSGIHTNVSSVALKMPQDSKQLYHQETLGEDEVMAMMI